MSPYVALWNRLADFDPADLDDAFARSALVKASLMRITLHAVDAREYPVLHQAMLPTLRATRLGDRRFTGGGLTAADADALVPALVAFAAEPRDRAACEAHLAELVDTAPGPGLWWALRAFAPLVHAPTDDPWSFGRRPRFVAAPTSAPRPPADVALQHLVRRHLAGFGPASVADVAQFTLRRRTDVRAAIAALAAELVVHEGPEGEVLHDVADGLLPDEDVPAPPRLLAMWDSVLLAHADRRRVLPTELRPLVIRRNGDVLPTVLVDGRVSGVWRPVEDGIEVTPLAPIPAPDWKELAGEARSLATLFAGRDPRAYARFGHWWSALPSAGRRLLAA
ncbi:hypothetical protein GCM10011354_20860 [Egicoccus halophilus]|uniref:Winged helix DNA-binding domain-containing protein n=1 Tax=Egicoccus halophilus TaxID=1670830 RepID=A0A8J3ES87_9ACTN|nr:hypothetical protein GCM10011354_20860 [Egicoccus halophilus]